MPNFLTKLCIVVILFLSFMLGVFVWGEGLITWHVFGVVIVILLVFKASRSRGTYSEELHPHLSTFRPGFKFWFFDLHLRHSLDGPKVFGGMTFAHRRDINCYGCRADSGRLSPQMALNNSSYAPILYAYATLPIER